MPIQPYVNKPEILRLAKLGYHPKDIADEMNICVSTVYYAAREVGQKFNFERDRKTIKFDEEYAIQQIANGVSVKALSDELGISRSVIVRVLNERGITQPNRSEGMYRRMSQTSREDRLKLAKAAHDAVRGRPVSINAKIKMAKTKAESVCHQSPLEVDFMKMLDCVGVAYTPQLPVKHYNCDIACNGVAVEIWGGNWHFYGRHAARTPERFKTFHENGWHVIAIVHNKSHQISDVAATFVRDFIAWVDENKHAPKRHVVIYGDGIMINEGDELGEVNFTPVRMPRV